MKSFSIPKIHKKVVLAVALCAGLVVTGYGLAETTRLTKVFTGEKKTNRSKAPPLEGFSLEKKQMLGAQFVVPLVKKKQAVLTLHPTLQETVEKIFKTYRLPYAGLVAMEPNTGKILAYVSYAHDNPTLGDLAVSAAPPAASVFKIVTGSALIGAGVRVDTRVCYLGGASKLFANDLIDSPRDRYCATLATAMGQSINTIFAKLASRHLHPTTLHQYADAFGFGQKLPFDWKANVSSMEIPHNPLEFARTAAGFWHTHLSPLHGALIAATIANRGAMPKAAIVEEVQDSNGRSLYKHEPSVFRQVISEAIAQQVASMMQRTVTEGTSHKAFYDGRGRAVLEGVSVAGKTGSLTSSSPYRAYSWWVGFAPVQKPTIALAVVIGNGSVWHIKANYVAVETLRAHLFRKTAKKLDS